MAISLPPGCDAANNGARSGRRRPTVLRAAPPGRSARALEQYAGPTDVRTSLESTASPFSKLALAHAVGVMGDIFVTVALADSIFFNASATEARPKVLLYLLFTMAPFALVAPVLGPLIDRTRGGRRLMFTVACGGRAALCLFMAANINGLGLFPLAFASLVLSKGQNLAKSSLVPAVVDHESELVRANSRLQLISVAAGTIAAAPAAALLKTVGGAWVLRAGALVFVAATFAAFAIPKAKRVGEPETVEQRKELHASSIVVAGTAMGLLRGVVGFMMFFVGFLLKKQHEAAWVYGLVIAMSAGGNGLGVVTAPLLRRRIREEWILSGSLLVPAVLLVFAARSAGRVALCIAAFSIAMGAASGRLVFDSLLQRDAPDAARGRAFARFETRFQLVWVVGGVLAVLFPGKERGGLFLLALVLLFAGLFYFGTARRLPVFAEERPSGGRRSPRTAAAPTEAVPPPSATPATDPEPGEWLEPIIPSRRRRHLRRPVRPLRPRPKAPPASAADEPPDAFPAGS